MRKLAMRIAKGLEKSNFWAVHEPELSRLWPDGESREKTISQFAKKYGWRLRFYQDGKCAVFEKEPPSK